MTAGVIALIMVLVFDWTSFEELDYREGILPIIYLGLFSTCICYLIQTTAQKYTSPTKAGIIMSMEGFFGSLFSVVLGIEILTKNLIIGGTLVLTSVILVEVKLKKRKSTQLESRVDYN